MLHALGVTLACPWGRACVCVRAGAQALLREAGKEHDVAITPSSLYDEWRAALEDKAGERVARVEDGFK